MVYKLPDLPENQRWSVRASFNTFLVVKLQEKRWWGWRTIASSTGSLDEGSHGVANCVDSILRRDYFAEMDRQKRHHEEMRRREIPFGETQ